MLYCLLHFSVSSHIYIEQITAIALTAAFDVFVLLMTLLKTLKHVFKMRSLGLPMGISAVLVRDGAVIYTDLTRTTSVFTWFPLIL